MWSRRGTLGRLVAVPALGLLLAAGALPQASVAADPLPESVTVKDGRTSDPSVDIASVRLDASWYWDSEQSVAVTVPHGFRAGHRLTVWFDIDGDDDPEGHFELRLREPKKAGGKYLRKEQEFRVGGGWDRAGELVRCTGSEGFRPVAVQVRPGVRTLYLALDLWWCLKAPSPDGAGPKGAWRTAVRLAKDGKSDTAPSRRGWSPAVLGWGPCDPSGGDCP